MIIAAPALGLLADVPVDPDGDQARQWIIEELSKPEYQAARPTWWDLLSKAVWDWLNSLHFAGGGGWGTVLLIILVVVVAGILIAAFFIFGMPRLNRRSTLVGSLFGADEDRDSESLRRSADAAAARGDWNLAIEERFRALARVLTERVLVSTDPGTTARGFATRAGAVFPRHVQRLTASARVFDDVRYLGKTGTEEDYSALAQLESELRNARATVDERTPAVSAQ